MGKEIDTTNRFLVGMQGDGVRIMRPVPSVLTKADALNLAAWLAVLTDFGDTEFTELLTAVRNT